MEADFAGLAGPFLLAAASGREAAVEFATELENVLRIAMFCVGARDLPAFRSAPRLVET